MSDGSYISLDRKANHVLGSSATYYLKYEIFIEFSDGIWFIRDSFSKNNQLLIILFNKV